MSYDVSMERMEYLISKYWEDEYPEPLNAHDHTIPFSHQDWQLIANALHERIAELAVLQRKCADDPILQPEAEAFERFAGKYAELYVQVSDYLKLCMK